MDLNIFVYGDGMEVTRRREKKKKKKEIQYREKAKYETSRT